MMHHQETLDGPADELIRTLAVEYLRQCGATESNASHLTDQIMGALHQVECEEAFDRDFVSIVERAFNRLRLLGYFCEQNWQCCRSCGWDAIDWDEADQAVWYHSQDREDGIKTGKLYLVWTGDCADIREALEAEGLVVEHDGTEAQRIRISLPQQEPANG